MIIIVILITINKFIQKLKITIPNYDLAHTIPDTKKRSKNLKKIV